MAIWGTTSRSTPALVVAALLALFIASWQPDAAARALPGRLSDAAFWRLVTETSEDGGSFPSDNLVSNELAFQTVLPKLRAPLGRDAVYIGVGPEQNFTYIAELRPAMAFIVDIRRQNLLLHLLYKAIFELSPNRDEFAARLFSRQKPPTSFRNAGPADLLAAISAAQPSEALFQRHLDAVMDRLTRRGRFVLDADDRQTIANLYRAFFYYGPDIAYSPVSATFPMSGWGGQNSASFFPTYRELMTATDGDGQLRSYLASEERYQRVREMQRRNLVVPIVGDFAGDKALRAVGRYVRDRGGTVSTFYTSNVEQYLFRTSAWKTFYDNVSLLPLDESSRFVRAFFEPASLLLVTPRAPEGASTVRLPRPASSHLSSSMHVTSVLELLAAIRDGQVSTYSGVVAFRE